MITSLFYSHVKEVNSIFRSHTFKDGFGQSYRQYGFRIDRVLVLLTLCSQSVVESVFLSIAIYVFLFAVKYIYLCINFYLQCQSLKLLPFGVVHGLQ